MKLSVKHRDVQGKQSKILRREGIVPGIVYGSGIETPVTIQMDKIQVVKAYQKAGKSTPVELSGDGINYLVLFHELQLHPVKDTVLHVDFYAVNKDEVVEAEVPVILTGVSPFEKLGKGSVQLVKTTIMVEALPLDLPHDIKIDISWIESEEDVIHVSDIKLSEKVKILDDLEETLVTASEFKEESEEEETEVETAESEGDTDEKEESKE